jgi:hypothetical protein
MAKGVAGVLLLVAVLAAGAAGGSPTATAGGAAELGTPGAAQRRAPVVEQMVVFRSGRAVFRRVSSRGLRARVGRKRCAVAGATALAALLRRPPGRVRLLDFGSCSRRPRDGGGLFVRGIGPDLNRGQDGWVYKVGRRAATAGAADPAGPFGRGRLRANQRVTWYFCRLVQGGCQRTLALKVTPEPGGVAVTVTGHDDEGRGIRVAGATVRLGAAAQVTDASGVARFAVDPGTYRALAERPGMVRSFTERVVVR